MCSPFTVYQYAEKHNEELIMNRKFTLIVLFIIAVACSFSFDESKQPDKYNNSFFEKLNTFRAEQAQLIATIQKSDINTEDGKENILKAVDNARIKLKATDFWTRYLEPIAYRRMNGPLPVEWETEVFEKFEAPYKREGTGLTQIALYLEEDNITKEHLIYLAQSALEATKTYEADSITNQLKAHDHFYLCNRLYLLNLAAIYTTGFECPDTARIIPELLSMMTEVNGIYNSFNQSFANKALPNKYIALYNKAISFVEGQSKNYTEFDHFTFIKDYVNPLFIQNQKLLNQYKVFSRNLIDYSLNKKEISIFNKEIYHGQNTRGIFHRVTDADAIQEIDHLGKLLFYDPILSGNNKRSCASCHKPTEYFTDTSTATALQFNGVDFLDRNSPSLVNAEYNHLIMLDGKHISLQNQALDVMSNPLEMGCAKEEILDKVLSCKEYEKGFKKLLKYTPTEKEVTLEHITSALTFYYSKFSNNYAAFDDAMNNQQPIAANVKQGFNLFMSKAQCATCHFVPQFNGVKPPYVGSEFEVLGVPEDKDYTSLSNDKGRHGVHKADEMVNAFRTGSIRNITHTKPYMHNGVFNTLEEVVAFYNEGGGAGHGLIVSNQTLASDSLGLSKTEQATLIKFMESLDEKIVFEDAPNELPISKNKALNTRKVGGEY